MTTTTTADLGQLTGTALALALRADCVTAEIRAAYTTTTEGEG